MKKKRIIVKIGSSSLTNTRGEIDQQKLTQHVQAIATLKKENYEVILVTSGAVAAGFAGLKYPTRPVTLKGKQAAAAIGQSILIKTYIEQFEQYDITPAQILLTRADFSDRERYQNAFQTLTELLCRGILPIINENDTIAVDELTFGDNDMLAALVSGFVHAHQLIIFTDINGIYTSNPNLSPDAKKLNVLHDITDKMIENAGDSTSKVGTGGMKSKLIAAKTALSLGTDVYIGNHDTENMEILLHIVQGHGDGTYITNQTGTSINTKRQWILLHSTPKGSIHIDEGAEQALVFGGRSLLLSGVYQVTGDFHKGDVIHVYGKNGLLGKGESQYTSTELNYQLKYRQNILSHEVIHHNNWVLVKNMEEESQ